MRYCINITSGALAGTLEDDDLRGEGRWERLVARGLISTGEQVGTPSLKWQGDAPNWIGYITDLSDCAYITIYGGLETLPRSARVYLFQFFSAPNAPIEEEIRTVMRFAGRSNVFLTHSYPSDGCFDRLPEDLRDRTALLPMPVPDVIANDPTENTVLFYPSRSLPPDSEALLRFIRQAMDRDSRLTFESITSTYYSEACELSWKHPLFCEIFDSVRARVTLHPSISHAEVQKIYARTRLVVCPCGYGGPPLESARCGLPVIALERDCSLYSAPYTAGFPELPRLGVGKSLIEMLERLLYDIHYARAVGNACRRYVAEHFSHAAFGRALDSIMART